MVLLTYIFKILYLLLLYELDELDSAVFGSIIDGVFEGKIISPKKGNYFVEKSSKYTYPHGLLENSDDFHSVIYKDDDVLSPYHNSSSK